MNIIKNSIQIGDKFVSNDGKKLILSKIEKCSQFMKYYIEDCYNCKNSYIYFFKVEDCKEKYSLPEIKCCEKICFKKINK